MKIGNSLNPMFLLLAATVSILTPVLSQELRQSEASDLVLGTAKEGAYTTYCKHFSSLGTSSISSTIESKTELPIIEFRKLQNKVWVEVSTIGHRPAMKVKDLIDKLKQAVKNSCTDKQSRNSFISQWLLAEAIGAWTLLNIGYDKVLASGDTSVVYKLQAQDYLDRDRPTTICGGIALFVREVSRHAGLRCTYVGGYFREVGFDISSQVGANHAWVNFEIDGFLIPSDPTVAAFHRYDYLKSPVGSVRGKLSHDVMMPISLTDWEVFLSSYYPYDEASNRAGDRQCQNDFLTYDLATWKRGSNKHITKIQRAFRDQDRARSQKL